MCRETIYNGRWERRLANTLAHKFVAVARLLSWCSISIRSKVYGRSRDHVNEPSLRGFRGFLEGRLIKKFRAIRYCVHHDVHGNNTTMPRRVRPFAGLSPTPVIPSNYNVNVIGAVPEGGENGILVHRERYPRPFARQVHSAGARISSSPPLIATCHSRRFSHVKWSRFVMNFQGHKRLKFQPSGTSELLHIFLTPEKPLNAVIKFNGCLWFWFFKF